jgi:hypothetical protein
MHAAFAQFRSIRQDAQDNMVSMATKLTAILRMSSATELYALPGAMHAAFAQFRSIRREAQDNMVSMATKLTAILRMSSASRSAAPRAHAYWSLNSPFSAPFLGPDKSRGTAGKRYRLLVRHITRGIRPPR